MTRSILILGGESSGKTTIAKRLAEVLKPSILVLEYGREYGETNSGVYTLDSMTEIAQEQRQRELAALSSGVMYQIFDTTHIVTEFYSRAWFGEASPELQELTRTIQDDFTDIFIMANDFDFVQDGTRQNIDFSISQRVFYQNYLNTYHIPYITIKGDVETRLKTILRGIDYVETVG